MTIQQLRLALESAEAGSISAAAKKYRISQPNASMSIKKLEEELGYQIFQREGTGISLTEQGYHFLEHAQALVNEDHAIRSLGGTESVPRLRVGIGNIYIGTDAFLRYCHEKVHRTAGEYTCINVTPDAGTRLLKERKLDVIVSVQLKEMLPLAEKTCQANRFTMRKHAQIPICVRVRKDHPLVLDGTLDGSINGFKALSAYPYAGYLHLESILEMFLQSSDTPFGCSYVINTDEKETRTKILQETDAYSIGCQPTKDRVEKNGLISLPTHAQGTLITYIRKGDENIRSIADYLNILDEMVEVYQKSWE